MYKDYTELWKILHWLVCLFVCLFVLQRLVSAVNKTISDSDARQVLIDTSVFKMQMLNVKMLLDH